MTPGTWFYLQLIFFLSYCHAPFSLTPPIIIRGNKLYDSSTGQRFFMKGITYEYAIDDTYFQKYGENVFDNVLSELQGNYNVVRFYNINPDLSYSKIMSKLSSIGVYAMVAASPDNDPYYGDEYRYVTLRKDLPANSKDLSKSCYPALLLKFGKKVVSNFAAYDNTLAIVTANEIMQRDLTAAACVKQYIADLKNWMRGKQQSIRMIPLAYAAADSAHTPSGLDADGYDAFKLQGLICGDRFTNGITEQSVDIFLLNTYRWLEGNDYITSGYQQLANWARAAPVVVGMGEFGQATPGMPRKWENVPYLLGVGTSDKGEFGQIYSGGTAYSYGYAGLDAASTYPFILGGGTHATDNPGSTKTPDYANLVAQYKRTKAFSESADWDSQGKCIWMPSNISGSSTAPSVVKYGWLVRDCNKLSLAGDKGGWDTTSREGVVCTDNGAPCDVDLGSSYPTSQQQICGFVDQTSGGAHCSTDNDCGLHGSCSAQSCICLACYTGASCSIFDSVCAAQLPNYKDAPQFIFMAAGSVIGIFVLSFIVLYFQWQTNEREMAHVFKKAEVADQNPPLLSSVASM